VVFRVDPRRFVLCEERETALRSLDAYFNSYTGRRFEAYADRSRANEYTASDFLAVSMLGVSIPADAAIWLLEEGGGLVAAFLSDVPAEASIETHQHLLQPDSVGWRLWELLANRKGLGRTKTSKLLAAKRPHLFPIYDQHVGAALMQHERDDYWAGWIDAFRLADAPSLADLCSDLLSHAGPEVPRGLSTLRVLDIVVWMRVHGDPVAAQQNRFWDDTLGL
jgi:hypothetical protein